MKAKTSRYNLIITMLVIVLIFFIGLFTAIGTAKVSVGDIFKIIVSKIPLINEQIDLSNIPSTSVSIIWNLRLPGSY